MALVVEDGTGLATAESYISVADADTRHTAYGNTTWAALSTTNKEIALRKATRYMLESYRSRWQGLRRTSAQALDWPRSNVVVDGFAVDPDSVPDIVANACADLALKASTADLSPDQDRPVVREKVGPLETEYAAWSSQATRYIAIDDILAPFLTGSRVNAALVRI